VFSCNGAGYDGGLPYGRVTGGNGIDLQYAAAEGLTSLSDLSYAMYSLDAGAYSGDPLLGVDWIGYGPADGVWLGVANWSSNRWDWRDVAGHEQFDLNDLTSFSEPGTGRMVVAVVSTRAQSASLHKIALGNLGVQPPVDVSASDSGHSDKVVVTWSAPNDGDPPASYRVYRSTYPLDSGQGIYDLLDEVGGTSFEDLTVNANRVYYYAVSSVLNNIESEKSAEDSGHSVSDSSGWTRETEIDLSGLFHTVPFNFSLAAINNNPTLVYTGGMDDPIYYVRAADPDGLSWGEPFRFWEINCGLSHGLSLADSPYAPGIAFVGPVDMDNIAFMYTEDRNGADWNTYILCYDPPEPYTVKEPALAYMTDSWAVAFRRDDTRVESSPNEIMFERSNEAYGYNWLPREPVVAHADPGGRDSEPKLIELAGGIPAIVFVMREVDAKGNSGWIYNLYMRASDSSGNIWLPPVELDKHGPFGSTTQHILIADSRPAVFTFHHESGGQSLQYECANDELGDSWPQTKKAERTVVDSYHEGGSLSFWGGVATVNGRPAALYQLYADGVCKLRYVEAQDKAGTAWNEPLTVEEFPAPGPPNQIAKLGAFGNPQHACAAYFDYEKLVFTRLN
jgi:hypothetical protein